ncbi:alanine racemase [Burkholderia stagnalis]
MTSPPSFDRPNQIVIDFSAIDHNLAFLRSLSEGQGRVFATLKADAYGFGLTRVAQYLDAVGIDGLAVADAADGLALRSHGIRAPVLVHSGALPGEALARAAHEADLTLTVQDHYAAEAFAKSKVPTRVFVKFDSGLERLGVAAEDALRLVRWIRATTQLRVDGLYTHLHAPAGERLDDYLDWQQQRVEALHAQLRASEFGGLPVMVASTAVLRRRNDALFDAIDPGSALFGMDNGDEALTAWPTRLALRRIESALVQVRHIDRRAFEDLAPFPLEGVRRVGILPIGFRDNFDGVHAGYVLVNGKRAPVLGAASLEVTRVDLTHIPDARTGDAAVIFGEQGDEAITLRDLFVHNPSLKGAGLRLMMALGQSVARRYVDSSR